MRAGLINLLRTSGNVRVRFMRKGMLFFDGKVHGGDGYFLKEGKVTKIPINVSTLTTK